MIDDLLHETKERMESTIKSLRHDLSAIRTGRANPALLDQVKVDYYGTATAIHAIAVVTVPEARLIAIRPYAATDIGMIEKAIRKSELGLNPNNDGKIIRLALPPLTEERRRDLSRQVTRRVEEARVAVRNIRRDAISDMRDFEKEKLITEDDLEDGSKNAQEMTDKYIKEIDKIGEEKVEEIMEV